jgi:UDP-N-acetylglucosamine transferase subunit ALG13
MARGGYTFADGVRWAPAVIFVTVGSNRKYPFDRLITALDQLPADDLIVQYGPGCAPHEAKKAHRWLTFDQVLRYMSEADTVVGHAGAGTILCAFNIGHTPVVMPRLKRFGETVDDHQAELAGVFERTGRVTVVWDAAHLRERVEQSPKRGSSLELGDGRLREAVRSALRGL